LSLIPPPDDLAEMIEDLKLLGKKEFEVLLRWRTKVNHKLRKLKKQEKAKEDAAAGKPAEEHDTDSELEEEIRKAQVKEIKDMRKERNKRIDQMARHRNQASMYNNVTFHKNF
jgi:AdoMet-dependent rRNA methyltransferase SPB1